MTVFIMAHDDVLPVRAVVGVADITSTIYTCPQSATARLLKFRIVNISSAPDHVVIRIYTAAGDLEMDDYVSVSANNFRDYDFDGHMLLPDDTLRVTKITPEVFLRIIGSVLEVRGHA